MNRYVAGRIELQALEVRCAQATQRDVSARVRSERSMTKVTSQIARPYRQTFVGGIVQGNRILGNYRRITINGHRCVCTGSIHRVGDRARTRQLQRAIA